MVAMAMIMVEVEMGVEEVGTVEDLGDPPAVVKMVVIVLEAPSVITVSKKAISHAIVRPRLTDRGSHMHQREVVSFCFEVQFGISKLMISECF